MNTPVAPSSGPAGAIQRSDPLAAPSGSDMELTYACRKCGAVDRVPAVESSTALRCPACGDERPVAGEEMGLDSGVLDGLGLGCQAPQFLDLLAHKIGAPSQRDRLQHGFEPFALGLLHLLQLFRIG